MSIHSLPVEILSRIFVQGIQPSPPSPYLLRPHHKTPLSPQLPSLDYQILVSHVCQHWRKIALETPSLWTTLVFLEFPHIKRAETLLARIFRKGALVAVPSPHSPNLLNIQQKQSSNQQPIPAGRTLTIVISTVAQASHIDGVTIAKTELHAIFQMLRSYLPAWRALHLVVRDNVCKAVAREHLGNCGPGPSLETLQLYHFEDFKGAEDLYEATYRRPVVVFDNTLPKLENVSLIGVNLRWAESPYLYDGRLRRLELALHADKIRPPYEWWEKMLRGCGPKSDDLKNGKDDEPTAGENKEEMCMLEELSLHYSGPKVGEGEAKYLWRSAANGQMYLGNGHWKKKIWMPRLERLSLTDLDPDYLCKIIERLVLPALRKLELDLPEQESPDQDFTPFVEMLGRKDDDSAILPFSREGSLSAPDSPASESSLLSLGPVGTALSHHTATSPATTPELSLGSVAKLDLNLTRRSPDSISSAAPTTPGIGDNFLKCALKRVDAERTFPQLQLLEHLTVTTLACSADSWRGFLRSLTGLKVLEIDFGRVSEEFWDVLMEREMTKRGRPTLLPSLQVVKLSGLDGERVHEMIRWRSIFPHGRNTGVSQWLVRWGERMRGRDKALDGLVDAGIWVQIEGERVHRRVKCWDEDPEEDEDEEEMDAEMGEEEEEEEEEFE